MSLFKNKKKNNDSVLILLINEKLNEAREKHEKHFYYPLDDKDAEYIKNYYLKHFQIIVEPDYKINNVIMYKFYGYSID